MIGHTINLGKVVAGPCPPKHLDTRVVLFMVSLRELQLSYWGSFSACTITLPRTPSKLATGLEEDGTVDDSPRVNSGVVDQEGSMTNGDLRSIIVPLVLTVGVGALAMLIAVLLGIAWD